MRPAFSKLQSYNSAAQASLASLASTPDGAAFLHKCISDIGGPITGSSLTNDINTRVTQFGLKPIMHTTNNPAPQRNHAPTMNTEVDNDDTPTLKM